MPCCGSNLHGRRDNKYKARIKILVDEMGLDAYRSEVEPNSQPSTRRLLPVRCRISSHCPEHPTGGAKLEAAEALVDRTQWSDPVGWITMLAHTKCLVTRGLNFLKPQVACPGMQPPQTWPVLPTWPIAIPSVSARYPPAKFGVSLCAG